MFSKKWLLANLFFLCIYNKFDKNSRITEISGSYGSNSNDIFCDNITHSGLEYTLLVKVLIWFRVKKDIYFIYW